MRAWGQPAVLALAAAATVGLASPAPAPASAGSGSGAVKTSRFSVPYGRSSMKGTVTWYADRAVFTTTEVAADGCHVFAYVAGGRSKERTTRNIYCDTTRRRTVTLKVTSPNVALVSLYSFDLSGISSSCYPVRGVCDRPVLVTP
ncbi:hypothetical protein [Actinomadura harenae]|uniref:Secreted protein n=1 Tax=Actinomadura harenae TaxID=2483351 RepID=A0A3M2MAR2_9ACTN|nr:hypothetical protein [Actinomadura harenae]RMI46571.1 hypothetical protein EBO15_06485 [Actinomadura harenae]